MPNNTRPTIMPTMETPSIDEELFLVKKLDASATLPTRGSASAAGYDLYR